MTELTTKGKIAKKSALQIIDCLEKINPALEKMADALEQNSPYIIEENAKDMKAAKENNMTKSLQDRLLLNTERIAHIALGLRQVAALPSPLGKIQHKEDRPNGLKIERISVPLGVVGIIYESRPNVTADASALCLKSGNAVILRGGKESINSNVAIVKILTEAAMEAGLPEGCIQLIEDTSRESSIGLMKLNSYLDVIIPRGGVGLKKAVMENATVPFIETGAGNCHVYVDFSADLKMAEAIVVNSKTTRPSVCNSAEKLLVHEKIAEKFLPNVLKSLADKGVRLKGCGQTRKIYPQAEEMPDTEWGHEYLDMIMGIKVVTDVNEAITHINEYSSKHSEAIVTETPENGEKFLSHIDSSSVYLNASTRFTDGFEFGLGAEMGISTQKIHARGPMGLEQLTSAKYVIRGSGQIR